MSLTADGPNVLEFEAGAVSPPVLIRSALDYSDDPNVSWPRRLTSIFVVTPSEVTQLGWYHTLYHAKDLLLVGTGENSADAVSAIRDGWADLVLVDVSTDNEAGFQIERQLLECHIGAKYLFTSGESRPAAVSEAISPAASQTIGGASPMLYTRCGVSSLLADLRSAVDILFAAPEQQVAARPLLNRSTSKRNQMIDRAQGAQK